MGKDMHYLIKNVMQKRFEKDFAMNTYTALVFVAFVSLGFVLIKDHNVAGDLEELVKIILFPLVFIMLFIFAGRWEAIIKFSFLTVVVMYYWKGADSFYFSIPCVGGAIMGPFIQVAKEWERAVILRLGKFKKVKGPGLFILMPFIDTVTKIVDMRIRVTDFVAETTLTKDSVPVTVDALAFWLIWDAEKAILEVENYMDAVVLSAQTALREAISKNDLSTLLENSNEIREFIRIEVDKKTTEWGITIQQIEITEIKVPESLQELLSKTAQAEREKKARILLGEAEVELAKQYTKASDIYADNNNAIRLRGMNIINEGLKNGNSMILPEGVVDSLGKEGEFGLKALTELRGKIPD